MKIDRGAPRTYNIHLMDIYLCLWSTASTSPVRSTGKILVNGMSDMSYPDRLRKLKLPTLAYRRIRGDMIEIYKLLHGKYDSNTSNIINLYIKTITY